MAKRPDTQESLVFALELLRRIPRHRRITARELHKQLQEAGLNKGPAYSPASTEVIERAYFDIECDDREKPYGYRWIEQQSDGICASRGWACRTPCC